MSVFQKISLGLGVFVISMLILVFTMSHKLPQNLQTEAPNEQKEQAPLQKLRWPALLGLDLKTGQGSEALLSTIERDVRIPGFVVPLEISDRRMVSEFLLVPTRGACIHTPAPPPNQMIFVQLASGGVPARELGPPIWISGSLSISNVNTQWGKAGFAMLGHQVEPYTGGY